MKKDVKSVLELFREALDARNLHGKTNLWFHFKFGPGVDKVVEIVVVLFRKVLDAGQRCGKSSFGVML